MGEALCERIVAVAPALAGKLAGLFSWDAPFLPEIRGVERVGERVVIVCRAEGRPLAAVGGWPRGARAAAALQVVACATFLIERGFLPLRGMLRRARVTRSDRGVRLLLAAPPLLDAESVRDSLRLRDVVRAEAGLLGRVLVPVLSAVLPERRARLAAVLSGTAPWEVGSALSAELMAESRAGSLLRHPEGPGRALWARRFVVPEHGVHWVESEEVAARVATAALLRAAAQGRDVRVAAGSLGEVDVARLEGAATAAGVESVVLSTLPVEGASPLPLGDVESLWILGPRQQSADAHAKGLMDLGRDRPVLVKEVLEVGAASAFTRPPEPPPTRSGRLALASAEARRALLWLESAPAGLAGDELARLEAGAPDALAELSRLGLVLVREGAWHAVEKRAAPDRERLLELSERLPEDSPRRLLATALLTGDAACLARWCEERLTPAQAGEVLAVAGPAATLWPMSLLAAEAALMLGRLTDSGVHLEAIPKVRRKVQWHALRSWWAVATNAIRVAEEELRLCASAQLPPRFEARRAWIEAQLAFIRGDRAGERECFARAAGIAPLSVPDAVTEVEAERGPGVLRRVREVLPGAWDGDTAACALYTLGARAWFRSSYPAAATALRAALRVASGRNPKLIGEIHADLGAIALQEGRPEVAERHLLLGERFLERAGSRRAVTVVRFNRAVAANDVLDWQRARDLVASARELRGAGGGTSATIEDLELARADLARGDLAAVEASLPVLAEAVAAVTNRAGLTQSLAALRAQLALSRGDLTAAAAAAREADEEERELVMAVVRGDAGTLPPPELPRRWGLKLTAELLAHRRRADEDSARAALRAALAAAPREAAVAFVRFAACLRHRGEGPGPAWSPLRVEVEKVLEEAGLAGWAAVLRRGLGLDALEIVRALDGILSAGSDALDLSRLSRLVRAVDLDALEIAVDGRPLVRVGTLPPSAEEIVVGSVAARAAGNLSEIARSALLLILRQVPGLVGGEDAVPGRQGSTLFGSSPALAEVRRQIARWAPLPAPVLLTGEPGTGKELVARELHRASGRHGEFVPVNCAGIPSALLESELFGVVRGAFTGADRDRPGLVEAAAGGTLFLDEVGELPLELQGKLLRLLQEREVRRVGSTLARTVDVRFLAATNRDLAVEIAAGRFRQDLYYRLAYAVIEIPPLRERPDDIEALAHHFTAELSRSFQRPGVRLSPAALALLRRGAWPGNVRELESCLARAVAAARPGEVLGPDRFAEIAPRARPGTPVWAEALASFRHAYFSALLEECGGNRSAAARRAGISRQTLLYHLKDLEARNRKSG